MSGFSRMVVALAESAPVRSTFTNTRAGKALVRRFVAGDTLAAAIATAAGPQSAGNEGVARPPRRRSAFRRGGGGRSRWLCRLPRRDRAPTSIDGNVSIKLTQLGLAFDPGSRPGDSRSAGCRRGAAIDLTVTIDMEDSTYTEAHGRHLRRRPEGRTRNLGLALQAYLRRTPDDLRG